MLDSWLRKVPPCSWTMKHNTPWWWLFILLLGLVDQVHGSGIVASFPTSHSLTVNHIALDQQTGKLYVGAKNNLYQLTSNLVVEKNVTTGPMKDSTKCRPRANQEPCQVGGKTVTTLLDNSNKVLVLYKEKNLLITCGSIFQGTCQTRKLADITSSTPYISKDKYFVAANNASLSTVAFLGPGPPNVATDKVLYVGVTYSGEPAIRGEVPAISSRSLQSSSRFELAYSDTFSPTKRTSITIEESMRKKFPVDYKVGFSIDGFSYFLVNQKKSTGDAEEAYTAKLIQVCHNDRFYTSYTEIPIECVNSTYNLVESATVVTPGRELRKSLNISQGEKVVFVSFSKGQSSPNNNKPSNNAAVCIYPVSKIREKFTANIKLCFNGRAFLARQFYSTGKKCRGSSNILITSTYCGERSDNGESSPVTGTIALSEGRSVIRYNERVRTMTADTIEGKYTVLFMGTVSGALKKVHVVARDQGNEYASVQLSNRAVEGELILHSQKEYLYAMTNNKVYKIKVHDCGRYKTCRECLQSKDPYCGWCSLYNKCSVRTSCPSNNQELRWLSIEAWHCLEVKNTVPKEGPRQVKKTVILTVSSLPTLTSGHKYTCVFGSDRATTDATIQQDTNQKKTIKCSTPDFHLLPANTPGQDHVNVTLSIKSSESGVKFLSTHYAFYDCSVLKMCLNCSTSAWDCNWCVYENKCTHDSSTCDQRLIVHGRRKHGESKVGPTFCPQLQQDSTQVFLPNGVQRPIVLKGKNLPPSTGNAYKCKVFVGPNPVEVPAKWHNHGNVTCNKYQYTYTPQESTKQAKVELWWNNNYHIDDVYGKTVTIYKCSSLGPDCSQCVSMELNADARKYGCKWCEDGCKYVASCQKPTTQCPGPFLSKVSPLTGPMEGGTEVVIEGTNLGKSFTDVAGSVTIGEVECSVIRDKYVVSKRIVCKTRRVNTTRARKVRVKIANAAVIWRKEFMFQNPMPRSIGPTIGPKAGGTRVTIQGTALNTGGVISAFLGDVPCQVDRKSVKATQIICVTSRVPRPKKTKYVLVRFDGTPRNMTQLFTFTRNPNITKIGPLKTFISGGRHIYVAGKYLDSIKAPKMFVTKGQQRSNETECKHVNMTHISCPSPALTYFSNPRVEQNRRRRNTNAPWNIGFVMDGVNSVQNMSQNFPNVGSTLAVVPDPEYFPFEGNKKRTKGEGDLLLSIEGRNLNLATTAKEVVVKIGKENCVVQSLTETNLVCKHPKEQPPGIDANGRESTEELPQVVVRVGMWLKFQLGTLEYTSDIVYFPPAAAIGIGAAGGFLVLVIVIILIVCVRRNTQAKRVYKKMQIQLDTLESNVRNECKQAFAELQTDMSDLTSDLNIAGIPFWDYKAYTFKVLFPSLNDHPVLHKSLDVRKSQLGSYEQGLSQFNQLLNSKQFLLIFIRTLEAQKNFSIRDKAVVASLLMIVLQDKMEYATEIMKALLNELIDKSVEKKNPKLMLRRMESVVEKLLTNWLSLCLYGYLKNNAGRQLFMLYKSIKHQTDKGPVDAVTSEARYSLSEDRLLREKIEPKALTINVVLDDDREPVQCKVLDCDTITQAKEKMLDAVYKNTPTSRRPSVYDVDLQWRSGRSGHLPLQDEDVTTEKKDHWKRVNTLAHYHLPDGSTVALVPSPNSRDDMVRKVNGMVEITGTSLSSITPIITVEEGTKVWHLVKHHDDNHIYARAHKVISEIFLTRLLSTKGTLQQFIDDFFLTILSADNTLPPAVKYLFDFLDQAARRHNIVDPDVVHTWKSNSLPLRFWVNIIKNPDFVFDIHKSHIVDSCLSVIAQTLMDSCSTSEHKLGKDSPSNKLLFAKDIPRYKGWISKFYQSIQNMPPVSDQEMYMAMTELSRNNPVDFNVTCALKDLYKYATQYNFELIEALEDDLSAKKLHLGHKFEQVAAVIDGMPIY